MHAEISRRHFVKEALASSAVAALGLQARGQTAVQTSSADLPRGRIGKLDVSRLILGGNLLTHYTHSRDLRYVYRLAAHYNTDEKILETLAMAEAHGVNTVTIHNPPQAIALLRRYRRERGGKIQWIICPTAPVEPDLLKYRRDVEALVRDGADAIYLWGVTGDALVTQDRIDLVHQAVELAREFGVPSGVGAHSLDVVKACEKHGVNADFYIKTFHHHNYPTGPKPEQLTAAWSEFPGYWCRDPKETIEVMAAVVKPWIAFKVMAAGAIPPADAFHYAYQNGADFVLAGMFDFEIAEDVKIAGQTLASLTQRVRPWRG
jgi:hypothetical protein